MGSIGHGGSGPVKRGALAVAIGCALAGTCAAQQQERREARPPAPAAPEPSEPPPPPESPPAQEPPATAPVPMDASPTFPVSAFRVRYGGSSTGLPPVNNINNARVTLGKNGDAFIAPAGAPEQVTLALAELSQAEP